MSNLSTVIKEIQKRSVKGLELYSVIGIAENVRSAENLFDVVPLQGAKILDVRINPVENSENGLKIIPKDGSTVIVTFLNQNEAFLSLADEVEEINIKVGNSTFNIKDSEILFNNGDNDGLIKINDLVTKLNNLENDINNLKTAFASWVVVPSDGGLALKTIAGTWFVSSLTPTVKSDLEDEKIKH